MQRHLQGKSLLGATAGMGFHECEITDFAAAEQPANFIHMLAGVPFKIEQDERIALHREGGNFAEHGVAERTVGALDPGIQDLRHPRDYLDPGERR
jgi:hypothetical protein